MTIAGGGATRDGGPMMTGNGGPTMMTATDGTLETRGDISILRYERDLRHPIERVWRAITEPGEIEAWLARAELDLEPGGRVELEWLNTDEHGRRYEHATARGTITELDPPNVIQLDTDAHGVLRWELDEMPAGTRLTLTVAIALPPDRITENRSGWHVHLDFLEEALDGARVDWQNWPRDRWAAHHERYLAKVS
jgi:uncharacterized protein YndB with AHSA1/START domain